MKIGCIGLGNMGASLAKAIAEQVKSKDLLVANRSPEKIERFLHEHGGQASDNTRIFKEADVIFLGIKPSQFDDLLTEFQPILKKRSSVLLISMAAGLTLDRLARLVPSQHRFIRIMPNTPVAIGQGVISFAMAANTSLEDEKLLDSLLKRAGNLVKIDEQLLDAATGLAGCGPAFVYLFIEALADAGVKTGLNRETALKMAAQTVSGAAQMVLETNLHPAVLKDQVCSPGGSTIQGVASLENQAFRGTVITAVDAAYKRTQELGK